MMGSPLYRWLVVSVSLWVTLISGCVHTPTEVLVDRADLTWPPEAPRVRYLGSIRTLQYPEAEGFWGQLFDWIRSRPEPRQLLRPAGIAVAPGGEVYVVDQEALSVYALRSDYHLQQAFDLGSHVAGLELVDVEVGGDGTLFVSDARGGRVLVLNEGGEVEREIRHPELQRPTGLYYDPIDEQLMVVDTTGHRVFRWTAAGPLQSAWGGRGAQESELNYPVFLTGDSTSWYVVDSLNFRVSRWSRQGVAEGTFGEHGNGPGTFARPKGIALDSDGHIYVVDGLFGNVQVFDQQGTLLLRFGETGSGPGQMLLPNDIAIANDRIYVVDSHNHRIQVFEYLPQGMERDEEAGS